MKPLPISPMSTAFVWLNVRDHGKRPGKKMQPTFHIARRATYRITKFSQTFLMELVSWNDSVSFIGPIVTLREDLTLTVHIGYYSVSSWAAVPVYKQPCDQIVVFDMGVRHTDEGLPRFWVRDTKRTRQQDYTRMREWYC